MDRRGGGHYDVQRTAVRSKNACSTAQGATSPNRITDGHRMAHAIQHRFVASACMTRLAKCRRPTLLALLGRTG